MTKEQFSLVVDGTVHTYYDLDEAARAYITFRENCCGTTTTACKDIKTRAMEIAYGSNQ